MGKRDGYFDYTPQRWRTVRLKKIAFNYKSGGISVGTYDLGRRYRVLDEGEYPPFKWETATFLVQVRNGKIRWGEQVEAG